ncbi:MULTISPECIES: hypothetical protein [Streptomyces]|uniref:Uncharacterized protein n=1 Tax=Streptomyces canarius TaxID=285453 RepID=A0ABQ3D135_9ACTN|nr:hypothetical protein [Streptomyces canarius]GHA53180.1 hypothetical protein GCM10010345_67440 [Streptomyces canarius]
MSKGPGGPAGGTDAGPPGTRMVARRAGSSWLVHPWGAFDQRSWMYAAGLAHDPEHTLVVVDVPQGASAGFLHDVVRALPAGAAGLRVVFGRTPPGGAAQAGRWLAARTGRVVVTALGRPRPTAEGALFVEAGQGPGWTRYDPGGGTSGEGRRFPCPEWEQHLPADAWWVSRHTLAEPVPAGLWLRPARVTPVFPRHRALLTTRLSSRPDAVTVVVGAPGAEAVPLADVTRLWWTLPDQVRTVARFAPFGPVTLPAGMSLGTALAEKAGRAVRTYNGLPIGPGSRPDTAGKVVAVGSDGSPGRMVMARESVQFPPLRAGEHREPLVTGHHWPLRGLPLLRLGVYRHGPDAVVEVTPSGLWIRGRRERAGAASPSVPVDERHELVLYDSGDTRLVGEFRRIAGELAHMVSAEYGVPVVVRGVDTGRVDEP